jgi:hypothetical protein
MAARLLGESNRNQILLTETAYKQIVDLDENPNYSDEFIELRDVTIKHELIINVYILKSEKDYINSNIAEKHIKNAKIQAFQERMKQINTNVDFNSPSSKGEVIERITEMTSLLSEFFHVVEDGNSANLSQQIDSVIKLPERKIKTRRGK